MHQLISGYKAQGWEVHLLSMNTHRHWVDEAELRTAYSALDSVTVVPFDNRLRPARLLHNFLLSRKPEHAERFYEAAFEKAIGDTTRRVRPDIVQMESLFLTAYLPAIRANCNAKLVLRMHNVEHQVWHRTAAAAKGPKRLYLQTLARRMKMYEEWVWRQYDLLLPITEEDAQAAAQAASGTPQHLTPFGIKLRADDSLQHDKQPGAPLRMYHLGAMDWLPNREGILWFIHEAWPLIRSAHPSAEFHFGGRLLEKDFAAPLPTSVFNHGAVKDAEAFSADKDVLIVPLRAGGGIRVKILEAMAAGKLVLSTSIGIQGIAARPGVHFLQADTPAAFAEAARGIAASPEKSTRIIENARQLVREMYDRGKILAGLDHRLTRLLGRKT